MFENLANTFALLDENLSLCFVYLDIFTLLGPVFLILSDVTLTPEFQNSSSVLTQQDFFPHPFVTPSLKWRFTLTACLKMDRSRGLILQHLYYM